MRDTGNNGLQVNNDLESIKLCIISYLCFGRSYKEPSHWDSFCFDFLFGKLEN